MKAGKQPHTSTELETTKHFHPVRGTASCDPQASASPRGLLALVFGADSEGQAVFAQLCQTLATPWMVTHQAP